MKASINPYLIASLFMVSPVLQAQFATGSITERVVCQLDSAQQYALFLPAAYSDTVQWPLILVFEPAARAMLPLESYAHFAEEYGYIMACSYNSRNGPDQIIFDAANAMYNDVFERFSVDTNRITLAGFSGGARISCVIALSNSAISQVIGCGAGFPYSHPPEQTIQFGYFGIVGQRGMNYQEMVLLDSILDTYCTNHVLQTFPNGHQWPDPQTFKTAFYWLETTAMRKGQIAGRQELIDEIREAADQNLLEAGENNDLEKIGRTLSNTIKFLEGLANTDPYVEKKDELLSSEAYRSMLNKKYTTRKMELALQNKYLGEYEQISLRGIDPDYPVKPKSWWKKEFEKIDALEDVDLVARLREFLINGSWEQHFNAMRLKRYKVALTYLQVYAAGLPDEPSPHYLMAIAYAFSEEPAEMYRQLDNAIDKGLVNPEFLTGEPAFYPYQQQKRFQKLLKELE